jgi:uncharacterized protein with HEPN domain
MKKKRHDGTYLEDMAGAAKLAMEFLHGISLPELKKDLKSQSAIVHQLAIIGEAANHISKTFQQSHPEIPWQNIIGMRNILIHLYDEMDLDLVWKTVHSKLPELLRAIKPLLK